MIPERITVPTRPRLDWFRVRAFAVIALFLAAFWGGFLNLVGVI